MKHANWLLKLGIGMALWAAVSSAQRPRFGERRGLQSFAERRVDDMSRRFELSEAQRAQALQIFKEADREAEPVEEKLEQANRALRDAVRRSASAEEIDKLAATVGIYYGQLAAINARAEAAFNGTLTPRQRESFERFMPRGGMRRGMPPSPPPHPYEK